MKKMIVRLPKPALLLVSLLTMLMVMVTSQPIRAQLFRFDWNTGDTWEVTIKNVDYFPEGRHDIRRSVSGSDNEHSAVFEVLEKEMSDGKLCFKLHVKTDFSNYTLLFDESYNMLVCRINGMKVPVEYRWNTGSSASGIRTEIHWILNYPFSQEGYRRYTESGWKRYQQTITDGNRVVMVDDYSGTTDVSSVNKIVHYWAPGQKWWIKSEKYFTGRRRYAFEKKNPKTYGEYETFEKLFDEEIVSSAHLEESTVEGSD